MNFSIVEGSFVDWDTIIDDFIDDYIYSNKLSNREILLKYDLSQKEFKELADHVKGLFGIKRRPSNAKYYYKSRNGFVIQKTINDETVYFGRVSSESVAKKLVKICIKLEWDIDECREIVKNYHKYINKSKNLSFKTRLCSESIRINGAGIKI